MKLCLLVSGHVYYRQNWMESWNCILQSLIKFHFDILEFYLNQKYTLPYE